MNEPLTWLEGRTAEGSQGHYPGQVWRVVARCYCPIVGQDKGIHLNTGDLVIDFANGCGVQYQNIGPYIIVPDGRVGFLFWADVEAMTVQDNAEGDRE